MSSLIEHEIMLNQMPNQCQAPRRLSPKTLEVAQEDVYEMLTEELIETLKSD